jgi:hypothetical protein
LNESERKSTKDLVLERNKLNEGLQSEGKFNKPFRYGIRNNEIKKFKQINQVFNVINKVNECITSKDSASSGKVQTLESLNVNTLQESSINKKEIGFSRQSYINCFYTNTTSLNNKFDEFIEEIDENKAQLIMVCETWWNEESAMNIDGFNLLRKDRE